jgi:gamma-glutamyltranspeptidase
MMAGDWQARAGTVHARQAPGHGLARHGGDQSSAGLRAPGKRMTSSMAPTLVFREGRPVLALGLPGGVRIFTSVLQALVNVIDHGMSLQEAVEAPRIWTQGQEVEVEGGVPEAVRAERAARVTASSSYPRWAAA